jgi:hypothetical protein
MKRLTTTEAQRRVDEIRQLAECGDNEAAHIAEDALFYIFVCDVRDNPNSVSEMIEIAEIVAGVKDIEYVRYCS